jgi:pyruvate dehydrogenase E1 component
MNIDALTTFAKRFNIPLTDEQIEKAEYYKPAEDSAELKYMHAQRKALGGYLPSRTHLAAPLDVPELSTFDALLQGSGDREMSTTMAFVRILTALARDKKAG